MKTAATSLHSPGARRGRNRCATPVPHKGVSTSEVATSPLPSDAPKGGQNCYVSPASSGDPPKRDKSQVATSPRASRVSKGGRNCYITPTFPRIPRKGDNSEIGYITPAFSGGQRGRSNCGMPLWGPNKVGRNQKLLHHQCLVRAKKPGRNCYVTRAFPGVPQEKETIAKLLP